MSKKLSYHHYDCAGIDEGVYQDIFSGEPDETVTDGSWVVKMYRLKDITIFLLTGEYSFLSIMPKDASMLDFFNDWNFGDVDRAAGLAEFGLKVA